ncbi:hypothetical protein VPNG_04511 [Cytospora leucostoma]|uniref:Uncharacterized protein n=1 Tax=Cytospora leucostoma TaxID=1230097 RepID=A0A423XCE3_9PEZI|nr:hypothetical protein VPNG_04511 [Cytospora leucostoma]
MDENTSAQAPISRPVAKLPPLSKNSKIQKRPINRGRVLNRGGPPLSPKQPIIYVGTKSPFMGIVNKGPSPEGEREEILVRGTGRAIATTLHVAAWFGRQNDCRVSVRTMSLEAVDDVVVDGEGGDEGVEEEGGFAAEEGTRVRGPRYDTLGGPNPVATLGAVDEEYHFCCGYPVADAQGVWACPDNRSSFTISNSRMMFGFAALENATTASSATASSPTATPSTSTSTSTPPAGSGDAARCEDDGRKIGLGVGVPLGVMALLAVAWGLWERRRVRTQSAAAVTEGDVRCDQSLHSDYENRNEHGDVYLQPAQEAAWPMVELRTLRSPVEMETHGGNESHES